VEPDFQVEGYSGPYSFSCTASKYLDRPLAWPLERSCEACRISIRFQTRLFIYERPPFPLIRTVTRAHPYSLSSEPRTSEVTVLEPPRHPQKPTLPPPLPFSQLRWPF
jgi:hypothetical protein